MKIGLRIDGHAAGLTALLAMLTLLALLPASLPGQTPSGSRTPSLEPGTQLRARGQGLELSGEFIRWDADTVVLRTSGPGAGYQAERALAITDIERLERGVTRSRGRGAARGALWGVLVGGVVGVLVGAAQETNCFLCPDSHAEGAAIGGTLLGGLGAGIGALVGVMAPGTRWEPVALEEPVAVPETELEVARQP